MTNTATINSGPSSKPMTSQEKQISHIRVSYTKDGSVDVKPLFQNYFRVNIWQEIKDSGPLKKMTMVNSKFIKIITVADGFSIVDLTKE